MEKWDVLDINGNKIADRVIIKGKEDFKDGEYHLVTVGWIYNSKNKFLLQKRAKDKEYPLIYANHGGSALQGETSMESMIREFYEEIGIIFKESELTLLRSFIEHEMIFDEYIATKDIDIDELKIDHNEVDSCEWFSLDEISDLIDQQECYNYKNNVPKGMCSFGIISDYISKL